MRSYKRYTRRKRLLKQIAVVALSPNRVFTKEQIYQHIYEEAESEVNNRIYGLIKNLRKKIEENPETPHYIETIRGVWLSLSGIKGAVRQWAARSVSLVDLFIGFFRCILIKRGDKSGI